jgi:V-type H+-transporting ATPase subunit E
MEPEVHIRSRKSDEELVKGVMEAACQAYKDIMKREVKLFKDRDVPCKVVFDASRYLPEYSQTEGVDSCMGGIVMHSRKGRIVCSNTIDERMSLCYQEGIPEIRRLLFPSFTRPAKEVVPIVKKMH